MRQAFSWFDGGVVLQLANKSANSEVISNFII
jgi:hypothetical protein